MVRPDKASNRLEYLGDHFIVGLQPPFQATLEFRELLSQQPVFPEQAPEVDEGAHDLYVYGDRAWCPKDGGQHRDTLFREYVGGMPPTSVSRI